MGWVDNWVDWVLEFEGDAVVHEPGGRYSRFGLLKLTQEEAEAVTLEEARLLALSVAQDTVVRFGGRGRPQKELLALTDLSWNAGVGVAMRLAPCPDVIGAIRHLPNTPNLSLIHI